MQNTQPSTQNNSSNQTSQPVKAVGQWMSILEASDATGMSPNTLRRYIKRGRMKSRRLGKTLNSKLEIWVTSGFTDSSSSERITTEGLDDVLTEDAELVDESLDGPLDDEYSGNDPTGETLAWFRERLDDRDTKIDVLIEKVEELQEKLHGANYRNGYLESQVQSTQEHIKLLVDSQAVAKKDSWWSRFCSWAVGKSK